MAEHTEPVASQPAQSGKYAKLPAQIKREHMITSQDVVQHPEVIGEADREREWLLRTAGVV